MLLYANMRMRFNQRGLIHNRVRRGRRRVREVSEPKLRSMPIRKIWPPSRRYQTLTEFGDLSVGRQLLHNPLQEFPMDAEVIDDDRVYENAAELFRAMAAPMRLRIISALCNGEKNVSELLSSIDTTQPNMSQHLNTLYQAGILGRRREGVSIYYYITNEKVVQMCRSVCLQMAIDE